MLAYGNILQGHKENCLLLPGTSRSVKLCLLLTEGERDISSASCFDWSRIGDHVRLKSVGLLLGALGTHGPQL